MQIKQNKGITLLGITITIIVMLILAGTTLKIVLGDGGIIKKTREAKEGVEDSSLYQKVIEAATTSRNRNGKVNQNTLENKLQVIDENSILTYDNTINTYSATVSGQNYTVGEYGNVVSE